MSLVLLREGLLAAEVVGFGLDVVQFNGLFDFGDALLLGSENIDGQIPTRFRGLRAIHYGEGGSESDAMRRFGVVEDFFDAVNRFGTETEEAILEDFNEVLLGVRSGLREDRIGF